MTSLVAEMLALGGALTDIPNTVSLSLSSCKDHQHLSYKTLPKKLELKFSDETGRGCTGCLGKRGPIHDQSPHHKTPKHKHREL